MTIERITKPSQVLEQWSFFNEGFLHLQENVKLHYNEPQAMKMLCALAGDLHGGYINVAKDETGILGFAVAREDTLPFSHFRTFCAHAIYYKQGMSAAVLDLMRDFEDFCRAFGVRRYSVLTRRGTTPAKRCFQHEKYGFRRMSFIFEKDL